MISVHGTSPTGSQEERYAVAVAVGVDDTGRRLERLAPLVHDLIAWELVYRSDAGTFVLREDVQQRLDEMSAVSPPTAQVYVGRKCEDCGLVGVTRLVDGSRICATCSGSTSAAPRPLPPVPTAASGGRGQQEAHSRWRRKAS